MANKGALKAMVDGLNPTVGTSLLDKTLPLIGTLAYLATYGLMMFDVIPNPEAAQALMGILGPMVGVWLHKAGQDA